MNKYFELSATEKRLEWGLLALFALLALTIGTGVYTQRAGFNYDRFLATALFIIGGVFLILLGWNGITNGNLIHKWMPPIIYLPIRYIIIRTKVISNTRLNKTVGTVLGAFGIIAGIVCFGFATDVLMK